VVLLGTAGGAAVLQVMGPPKPQAAALSTARKPALVEPAGPVPARKPPSTPNPAPPLAQNAAAIPDPDAALQEPAMDFPDRMMPRISNAGRSPAELYAAAFDPAERHPRVALVIDGAGLDREMTEQALRTLPSSVDLAFSAYAAPEAAAQEAAEARRQGRECLVSIPMEPPGFPTQEEGDRSLLTGADPEQNRQDLEWALSNVQGCVGATGGSDGLDGARFAESRQAFGDVLSAIDRRGLIYLDPRPGAPPPDSSAPGAALPRVVDVIVDHSANTAEPADAAAIDRNLARLQALALAHGSAIGLAGPPSPVLMDRVSVWAQSLAAHGVVLAPLTAIPAPRLAEQDGARAPASP
jgi:polysaccharide deacetylase 2 family uncharacterized protein YibQ